MKIVLEIPEALKGLEQPLRALLSECSAGVEQAWSGRRMDYEAYERRVAQAASGVECAAHAATLSALDIDAEQVLINDRLHRRVGRNAAPYRTQAGEVELTRSLYRPADERNAKTVDLVSMRAGVVGEGWLPGTARAMAHLLQLGPSREAELTAVRLGRLPYSRCSFERVGHEVAERVAELGPALQQQVVAKVELAEQAATLSVSLDRVSMPMEEPREKPKGRPRKDAPRRPVQRVYRMAYCATLTMHDAQGQALRTLRYGCMPHSDVELLLSSIASDVQHLRQRHGGPLGLLLLADGAAENWTLLDKHFGSGALGFPDRLIDFWHLLEKLSAAARVVYGEHAQAELGRWRIRLMSCNGAAQEILDELLRSGKERVRVGDSSPVHEAITYLTNNHDRMHYAGARRRGLPIGSGNVEATCKSLVGLRMKRPGARWKHITGEHVLKLRAFSLSDCWDDAMNITLQAPPVYAKAAA
jgi:hypothetical protein